MKPRVLSLIKTEPRQNDFLMETLDSYLEWTESDHLCHSKYIGLQDDKDARTVVKELAGEG